jgi:hypothetical protein
VFVEEATAGSIVGLGRLIGDGAWCFHLVDMAVLPDHLPTGPDLS